MPGAKAKVSQMATRPKYYAVHGYIGNQFKSFSSRAEAEQYLRGVSAMSKPLSKKAKSPKLVKVKRSRSHLPKLTQPTSTAEVLDMKVVPKDQAGDVYQVEYDGASKKNPGPAGAGALVRRPDGSVVCELREGIGSATNNVAEYRAFILGLKGALDRGIYRVRVQGDSKLVCEQVLGRWKVNQPTLATLCKEAQSLIQHFSEFSIQHVDRELNSAADQLANEAVLLPESKFVSSFDRIEARDRMVAAEAATLGDGCWRRDRERKTYGIFDFAECSKLRLACRSYYINFRSSNVIGAERLRSLFSPYKGTRVNLLAARPRVTNTSWILTRRCFANMAIRLRL
ncbi:uncharacterized protein [Physcomitrium patens]|uniref:uncharacterized protein isoform X2 n=1 Tax=Physcomitrium patens TaxID=3218 RepID=UPI000D179ACC|nr:uncharacterized protein LOC112294338 isoform X2 [Physcomitrium patens]|eukprot:XP_024400428.1 uncharacterized protein LOC112294338 isoform X2 [Physcomitrella patens]